MKTHLRPLLPRAAVLAGLTSAVSLAQAGIVVFTPTTPGTDGNPDTPGIVIPVGGQGFGYYLDLAQGRYTNNPGDEWVGRDANIQAYRRTGTITSMLFAPNNGTANAAHVGVEGWLGNNIPGPFSNDPGTVVGPGGTFITSNGVNSAGAYRQERTGYLGVRFLNSLTQQVNYGWIEFTTTTTSTPAYTATLNRWAFDDTGASILTGQTQAVPEPATLAALGLGAVAMLRKRRRA